MKSRILLTFAGIAVSATLAAAILSGQQQPVQSQGYTVTDLGTLGGTFSVAFSINNKGWVTGTSALSGDQEQHAFLWKGAMTDLGTLGGSNSSATFPLSESVEVPGAAEASTPDPLGEEFCDFLGFTDHLICLPFVWQNGVMTQLPKLGGYNGVANEVNNQGQVVGAAENALLDPTCQPPTNPPTREMKPVLWQKGEIQPLPLLHGDLDGAGQAINDLGQAVGFAGTGVCANEFLHAVLWQNGTVTDLSNLGGTTGNNPQDINNQGQVVGISNVPGDSTAHAFLWQNGVMADLGTLPGDSSSYAGSINSNNQLVGQSCDQPFLTGNCRAFLWQHSVMTDLNTLTLADSPLYLVAAFSINSSGEITGLGITSAGEAHAFLATPSNGRAGGAKPKPTLPENVRQLIRQRLHRGKSHVAARAQ